VGWRLHPALANSAHLFVFSQKLRGPTESKVKGAKERPKASIRMSEALPEGPLTTLCIGVRCLHNLKRVRTEVDTQLIDGSNHFRRTIGSGTGTQSPLSGLMGQEQAGLGPIGAPYGDAKADPALLKPSGHINQSMVVNGQTARASVL